MLNHRATGQLCGCTVRGQLRLWSQSLKPERPKSTHASSYSINMADEVLLTPLKRHPGHLWTTTEAILKTTPLTTCLNMDFNCLFYISAGDVPQGKGEQLVRKEGQGGTDTSRSHSQPCNSKLGYGSASVWYVGLLSPRCKMPHGRNCSWASRGTDAAYGKSHILQLNNFFQSRVRGEFSWDCDWKLKISHQ